MKRKLKPIEIIEWKDSFGESSWINLERIDDQLAYCISVGFVVSETREAVTITSGLGYESYKEDPFTAEGTTTIPKATIQSRKKIRIRNTK